MYAIIETGGKQIRVEKGDVIEIELLKLPSNQPVEFKNVLFVNDGRSIKIGDPYLKNCLVKAELLQETKGPKTVAYKYKKRKNYHRKVGHRQKYMKVKITEIAAA